MKSDDALLRMLTTHVSNVTSLIDDAQVFFMVRYKEDVANRRRFWFARGGFRKDFLVQGLKINASDDSEIRDLGFPVENDPQQTLLIDTVSDSREEDLSSDFEDGRNDDDDDDDHDDDDDECPVRKGAGGPTMNRIAKDDDDDDEKSGDEMGINCGSVEEDIDDCDAFNMLVQGEDEVASAFDGMRSVKPVEEDDDDDDNNQHQNHIQHTLPEIASRDDTISRASQDLDVYPPKYEREEEIQDVESYNVATEDLELFRQAELQRKFKQQKRKKKKSSAQNFDNLPSSVFIDGKRMDIKPGPKTKTAAQISPVWRFFGFLEWNGHEQFKGFTICRLCLKRVSRASHTTKGMRDHLQLWHRDAWRSVGGNLKELMQHRPQRQPYHHQQRQQMDSLPTQPSSKRWQPTDRESSILALHFLKNEFPDGPGYARISNEIHKSVAVVKQWFVNQRRRRFPARRFLPPEVSRCQSVAGAMDHVLTFT